MRETDTTDVVLAALFSIAPEAEAVTLDPGVEIREQVDFDSLDFLNFVEALVTRTGITVRERDYPELLTIDSCAAYLARRQEPQRDHGPPDVQ